MSADTPADPPESALAPSSPAARRLAIRLLLAGVVTIGMGQTVIFAVLPPIARDLGLHDLQVLSVFMTSAVFWVTLGPFWGRRSDMDGRRPFVLLGLSGYCCSMILFGGTLRFGMEGVIAGAGLYFMLLATRSVYGVLGSAVVPAAQAYIADRTPPEKRTSGLAALTAAFGLGAMLGPTFAGAVARIGPVAPIFATAALAGLAALTAAIVLNERTPPKEKAPPPKLSPFDKRIRAYLVYSIATAVCFAIPTQFTSFYVIDRLGASTANAMPVAGAALSAAAGASLLAQVFLVRGMNLQPRILMLIGPLLMAIVHVLIALSTALPLLIVGMLLSGTGTGLTMPGVISGASLAVTKEEQGAIAGLSNAASSSSFVIAPMLGYAIYALAPWAVFVSTAALAGAAAAFVAMTAWFGRAAAEEEIKPE